MSHPANLFARCLLGATLLAGPAFAAKAPSMEKMPTHRAFAQPSAEGAGCMNNGHLVSHAAYLPIDPAQASPCGHLLSTDTVLTVHHWDKT